MKMLSSLFDEVIRSFYLITSKDEFKRILQVIDLEIIGKSQKNKYVNHMLELGLLENVQAMQEKGFALSKEQKEIEKNLSAAFKVELTAKPKPINSAHLTLYYRSTESKQESFVAYHQRMIKFILHFEKKINTWKDVELLLGVLATNPETLCV